MAQNLVTNHNCRDWATQGTRVTWPPGESGDLFMIANEVVKSVSSSRRASVSEAPVKERCVTAGPGCDESRRLEWQACLVRIRFALHWAQADPTQMQLHSQLGSWLAVRLPNASLFLSHTPIPGDRYVETCPVMGLVG